MWGFFAALRDDDEEQTTAKANTGVSPLRRQETPPSVELTGGWWSAILGWAVWVCVDWVWVDWGGVEMKGVVESSANFHGSGEMMGA